jgi:inner membrane protein
MTGKTHKFIGIAAGGAAAYCGVAAGNGPIYMFYLVTVPLGAMLADIDHDNSKLGRSRKNIMTAVSSLFGSLAIVAVTIFLVDAYRNSEKNFTQAIFTVAMVAVPFLLLTALSKLKFVKENMKFMVKHRGIMHTLILPGFLFAAAYFINEPTFKILVTGVTVGYISHLLADMLTSRGCPVLFPFSKKNIRFMNITTGSTSEYIAAAVLAAGFAALFLSGLVVL